MSKRNAVVLILEKRNMQRKELQCKNCVKQSVTRYIKRERKIPKEVAENWAAILYVPVKFIIDEDYYCKELNENEENELMDFFTEEEFTTKDSIESFCTGRMKEEIERHNYIYCQTKKIKKMVESDINTYHGSNEISTVENYLEYAESNLKFYEKFLKLRNSTKISEYEWNSLLKALSVFLLNNSQKEWCKSERLAHRIYEVMLEERQQIEQERNEGINWYKEQWGEPKPEGL